jgi:protease I
MDPDSTRIAGARIAILIENDFEDGEIFGPRDAFRAAGADVVIVGPTAPTSFRGKHGATVTSDVTAGRTRPEDIDALVIPGGWAPDRMRMRHAMVDLVRGVAEAGRPVAAICHGPQMLISAKLVSDRMVTCWPSIAVDIKNAGGLYMDKPVIEDGILITSRKIDDVPAFSQAIIEAVRRRRGEA